MLLIHEDFFWNTTLARNVKKYDYFDYAVNESLYLKEEEELIIIRIFDSIKQEYHSYMDKYSKQIIISHFETLLN